MKSTLASILVTCIIASSALAQKDIPNILTEGLNALQNTGGKAAVAVWHKGSPMENNASATASNERFLAEIEGDYGKMVGFELIRIVPLSPSCEWVYIVIKYEKGPVYGAFNCYKGSKGWVIPTYGLHTRASEVLPINLLSGPN